MSQLPHISKQAQREAWRDALPSHWDAARVDAGWQALCRTQVRRRQLRRQTVSVVALLVVAGGATYGWSRIQGGAPTASVAPAPSAPSPAARARTTPAAEPQPLLRGRVFRVHGLATGTQVVLEGEHEAGTDLRLQRGKALFDVDPLGDKYLRVHVGPAWVEVVGTVFSVERQGDAMVVRVRRGTVKVVAGTRRTMLQRGQQLTVALPGPTSGAAPNRTRRPRPGAGASTRRPSRAVRLHWTRVAKRGDMAKAWSLLQRQAVAPQVETLLLASDVARSAGQPKQAAAYLHQLLTHHRGDARAPLAAFTLGRILLRQLHEPQHAAAYFQLTLRLDPDGELAEPALAQALTCWSPRLHPRQSKAAAQRYLRRFPQGPRAAMARTLLDSRP
ncbi:MAG: FecR domain-containing protein [Polyangiales bacterium]